MSNIPIQIPALGESVTEAIIASWSKKEGDFVKVDEILVELETDKVNVEIPAPATGILKGIKVKADDTVNVGDVIAFIEPAEAGAAQANPQAPPQAAKAPETLAAPAAQADKPLSPAVQRIVHDAGLDASKIEGTGPNGRILKGDALAAASAQQAKAPAAPTPTPTATVKVEQTAREERIRMTKLRQTIARRLVEATQTTAMLTTFNEVDMSAVMELRKRYQDSFVKKYGVKMGFMSFFIKATIEALKAYPALNAEIDGDEIVYKNYYDIGVAVGGGRGLVVPVLRDADQLSFAGIELGLKALIDKALANKLTIDEMQGGTFSISNGGIYGSMMSTPILNMPQSGILGMHNIVERPVAINGKVEIRPIMYTALSYDHRIVDGREAVSFLVRIKECIENPERILLEV
jgi:2-oxoglutarate dehydrogenase E2 component (dihydrolipoamide succinyltransferase)